MKRMGKQTSKEKEAITRLEGRIVELEDFWKRALADYANLEKRILAEKSEFARISLAVLIDKLLGVLDMLEKAEHHLKNEGLSLAVRQFRQVLGTEGVEEIKTLGEPFDPELMDCAEVVNGKENIVAEVCQKGYKLLDKVIRPAKVKVGKGPPSS